MTAPAGWYDDGSGHQRWWDGRQWGAFADEPPSLKMLTPWPGRPAKHTRLAGISLILAAVSILCLFYPLTRIIGLIGGPVALTLSIIAVSLKQHRTRVAYGALAMSIIAMLCVVGILGQIIAYVSARFG